MATHINATRQRKAEALEALTNIAPTRWVETSRVLTSAIARDPWQRQLALTLCLHLCREIKCTLTQNAEHTRDNYHDYRSVAIKHDLVNSLWSLERTPKRCERLVKGPIAPLWRRDQKMLHVSRQAREKSRSWQAKKERGGKARHRWRSGTIRASASAIACILGVHAHT